MTESLHSASWYRVADLKPAVRRHAQLERHDYRDQIWYVLRDPANERSHRFTPAANYILGLLDGKRTVDEVWRLASERLGDDAPTQDEFIRLLGQLHSADLLQSGVTPDTLETFRRHQRHKKSKWKQRIASPLAIRIPLFDPDRLLNRMLPAVRPLFGRAGFLLWALVVITGALMAGANWSEITEDLASRVLTPENLLVLWLVYPVVKILHEFGHGLATKVWGGEVHDLGIMFLVLMPIPYVEASSVSAFREKHKRVVVGGIGIMVELFLASIALFIWLNAEPGVVRALAYNVMLIGGVSTLFFNGNPLLRFDGYYVMADAIEIPNLATRSKQYLGYFIWRYLFNDKEKKSPAMAPGERYWFFFYGIAAFVYRLFITFFIILFVAGKFFVLGILLAIWAVAGQILWPLTKSLWSVFTIPQNRIRTRASFLTIGFIAALLVGFLLVPIPLRSITEGVIWLPEQAQVRSGADGFVHRLLAPDRASVTRGDPLVECRDPIRMARFQALRAKLRELGARLAREKFTDKTEAAIIRQEIEGVRADLIRTREQLLALVIKSPADGTFIVPKASDLPGRFLRRGDLIGYVLAPEVMTVRAVIDQDQIGLVREQRQGDHVHLLLANWGGNSAMGPLSGTILRETPSAIDQLPTPVLATTGGGRIPVDPRHPSGLKTLEKVFQLDISVPDLREIQRIGNRVYVRFDHGSEPIAQQLYRGIRQLFLRRFGV
uniref:Putative peptide zinc metalloprotease protein n=1 Tax=Candidatus Kentrum sp. DK TaxID=2126562 RepID=A0A450SYF0_9GAMM|nr:MAG: putative peptide zinc metalloprotease protein [Candidatus Kentron sp. DK]